MVSHHSLEDQFLHDDLTADDLEFHHRTERRTRRTKPSQRSAASRPKRRSPRTEQDQAFRCHKCKQFIGAPMSGGRHRNHCPNCLHSLHVDLRPPGDRRSECESLMRPRGLIGRRNGEQMILHECLGCGKTQPTRVAADDSPVLLMRLEPIGLSEAAALERDSSIEESA